MREQDKGFSEAAEGILTGMQIGDALAMPAHWYYDQSKLYRDYGEIENYLEPRNPHPDSILWRSRYKAINARGEILHEQAAYWGKRNVHYHQFLAAGENTVNTQLCGLLWRTLRENGGWDPKVFLEEYVSFMRNPDAHKDTYLEEYHRNFFTNYALGKNLRACAEPERHAGGLAFLFPVLAFYWDDVENRSELARSQMRLTHPGRLMEEGAKVVLAVFDKIREGYRPREAALFVIQNLDTFLVRREWDKWERRDTRECLRDEIGIACYIESAVPAILYLLLKHGDDPRRTLIENTMAGGDNVHRGIVLGALLGAAHGVSAFPEEWRSGLRERFFDASAAKGSLVV